MIKNTILILFVLMTACSKRKDEKEIVSEEIIEISNHLPKEDFFDIKMRAFAGDTNAYKEVREYYNEATPGDFLYWALVMSNKNNYSQAHLDVFYSITDDYVGGNLERFSEIDKQTQKLALSFLDKAVKANVQEAINIKKKLRVK